MSTTPDSSQDRAQIKRLVSVATEMRREIGPHVGAVSTFAPMIDRLIEILDLCTFEFRSVWAHELFGIRERLRRIEWVGTDESTAKSEIQHVLDLLINRLVACAV
jgi:hypothetical protein